MENPRLDDFWHVVDHILESDPLVRRHVFGPDVEEPVG
jgi:hypothetical protein